MDSQKDLSSMAHYHHTVICKATPFVEFTKWCASHQNAGMEDPVVKARRQNLKRLIDRDYDGNQSKVARLIQPDRPSQSYINGLLQAVPKSEDKKPKSFGEKAARKIEHALGLKRGQLDIPNSALIYDESRRDIARDALHSAVDDLDRHEQQEALSFIRQLQARRRKAG